MDRIFSGMKKAYWIIGIAALILGIVYSYYSLPETFFLNDEWPYYGAYLTQGAYQQVASIGIIGNLAGSQRVFGSLLMDFFFTTYGVSVTPFIILAVLFHALNAFLVWKLLYRFGIHPIASFCAGFFFSIASAGQQAISWPGASLQVVGYVCFMLIAIHASLSFIQTRKYIFLIFAFLSSYISFLWKPHGIVTPVLMLIFLLFNRKKIQGIKYGKIVAGIGSMIICAVLSIVLFRLKTDGFSFIQIIRIGWNAFLYPFIALSQIFIPYRLMFRLSSWFTGYMYPQIIHDGNIETIEHYIISDYLSVAASFILIIGMMQLYRGLSKERRLLFVFGILIFTLQFAPIAYHMDNRGISYTGSRYIYPAITGISMLLGVVIEYIIHLFEKQKRLTRYVLLTICTILCMVWLGKEMMVTRREVRESTMQGAEIRKTWDSFRAYPFPQTSKLVLFIRGNRTYYYPDNYLPFQQGSGYMLVLALQRRPFIDKSFSSDLKLMAMASNGYMEANGKKFGYYTDLEALQKAVKNKNIAIEEIYAYHFSDDSYGLEDITEEVRSIIQERLNK